ncbi:ATP-binding protein [Xanthobacter sp. V3C-3]|uniref:ATP-binding protein n=1 Tax=Xanthobacter lutulentifluminis TaxID=3119935 RepID=UPI0037293AE6
MRRSDHRTGLKGLLNPVTLMLVGLVVLVGVIPLAVAVVLYQLHAKSTMDEAEINARRTATLLLRSFEQAIEPIDAMLINFANDFNNHASPDQIYEQLRTYSLPAAVIQLTVTDRDGTMIASNLAGPGGPKVDLSDREHVRVQMGKDPGNAQLFISKPVLGRVSKKWTIQLTRPLADEEGKYAGVVIASYAISDFIEFYGKLRTEEDMLIGLVGRDGIIRARVANVTSFGDDVSKSHAFRKMMEQGSSVYDQKSPIDGVDRIGYQIPSQRFPINVVVAYSKAFVTEKSANFRNGIWGTALGLSMAMLFVALLGGRYFGLQRRLEAQEVQALARQREANVLDAISRVPGVAVMHVSEDGVSELGAAQQPLAPMLHGYINSPGFRSLASGIHEPHLRNEHLSDGRNEMEVEVVVAPLERIDRNAPQDAVREVVVFAVDQTQRRMEENKLYQMSKLASLGEVATGLAHEINQPLGVIRLAASNALTGMKMGLPPEHLVSKLDRIVQQTVRMSRIIDHMRIFGRKSEERLQPSRPMDAVEGALQVVGAHLRMDKIEVATLADDDVPQVLCRQDQLEQVLINLLQNARDAIVERAAREGSGFAGRIAVRVQRLAAAPGPGEVRIEVADNAGGVPAETIERIFQPFFTTKPPGKGTGLGLSVSFGIIRDHGGMLSVQNDAEGAVFTILMPALAPEGAPVAEPEVAEPQPS